MKKIKRIINWFILIGYICVFFGIYGSVGAVDLDSISLGQALIQMLICAIAGVVIVGVHIVTYDPKDPFWKF